MILSSCRVESINLVGPNIFVLRLLSPEIAPRVLPGQFINIKVNDTFIPLLRRPFSVYHVDGERMEIIFNAVGMGTTILSHKRPGDMLDVLGPLGGCYGTAGDFETAVLVAGGLGVAPMPLLTQTLRRLSKPIITFLGARTGNQIVSTHLEQVRRSSDDGTAEFHGTVVDQLRSTLDKQSLRKPKIFGCGPNAMLRSLAQLANEYDIPCEVSMESAMACGIGICQGCPLEVSNGEKKYALICREGPVFDTRKILMTDGQH